MALENLPSLVKNLAKLGLTYKATKTDVIDKRSIVLRDKHIVPVTNHLSNLRLIFCIQCHNTSLFCIF